MMIKLEQNEKTIVLEKTDKLMLVSCLKFLTIMADFFEEEKLNAEDLKIFVNIIEEVLNEE